MPRAFSHPHIAEVIYRDAPPVSSRAVRPVGERLMLTGPLCAPPLGHKKRSSAVKVIPRRRRISEQGPAKRVRKESPDFPRRVAWQFSEVTSGWRRWRQSGPNVTRLPIALIVPEITCPVGQPPRDWRERFRVAFISSHGLTFLSWQSRANGSG